MMLNRMAAFAAVTAACCLAGCGTVKPIAMPQEAIATYQGQPLTVVTYNPKTGYFQMTAGAAAFGVIGALAAASESEKLIEKYDLVSPSIRTADKLSVLVASKLKPSGVTPVSYIPQKGETPKTLSDLANHQGLVLEVQPGGWTTAYFPVNWSHYRTMYFGVSHLVDAASGKVIATAPCKEMAENDKGAPTYDELYADNAHLLKAKYDDAADDCASQMATALFPPGTPDATPAN
jgi:hypothetical protein